MAGEAKHGKDPGNPVSPHGIHAWGVLGRYLGRGAPRKLHHASVANRHTAKLLAKASKRRH